MVRNKTNGVEEGIVLGLLNLSMSFRMIVKWKIWAIIFLLLCKTKVLRYRLNKSRKLCLALRVAQLVESYAYSTGRIFFPLHVQTAKLNFCTLYNFTGSHGKIKNSYSTLPSVHSNHDMLSTPSAIDGEINCFWLECCNPIKSNQMFER